MNRCMIIKPQVNARFVVFQLDQEFGIDLFSETSDASLGLVSQSLNMPAQAPPSKQSGSLGVTSILTAIKKGHFYLIRKLIDSGVDVNERDWEGKTPLGACCSLNDDQWSLSIARMLLEVGASIAIVDKSGKNSLMTACINEKVILVQVFLKALDYNLNARDKYGHTALGLAAITGNEEVVQILIDCLKAFDLPIDPRHRGPTALELAQSLGYDRCANIIREECEQQVARWEEIKQRRLEEEEARRKQKEEEEMLLQQKQEEAQALNETLQNEIETSTAPAATKKSRKSSAEGGKENEKPSFKKSGKKQVALKKLATVSNKLWSASKLTILPPAGVDETGIQDEKHNEDEKHKEAVEKEDACKDRSDEVVKIPVILLKSASEDERSGGISKEVEFRKEVEEPIQPLFNEEDSRMDETESPYKIEAKTEEDILQLLEFTASPTIDMTSRPLTSRPRRQKRAVVARPRSAVCTVTTVLKEARERELIAKRHDYKKSVNALPSRKKISESKISVVQRKTELSHFHTSSALGRGNPYEEIDGIATDRLVRGHPQMGGRSLVARKGWASQGPDSPPGTCRELHTTPVYGIPNVEVPYEQEMRGVSCGITPEDGAIVKSLFELYREQLTPSYRRGVSTILAELRAKAEEKRRAEEAALAELAAAAFLENTSVSIKSTGGLGPEGDSASSLSSHHPLRDQPDSAGWRRLSPTKAKKKGSKKS